MIQLLVNIDLLWRGEIANVKRKSKSKERERRVED